MLLLSGINHTSDKTSAFLRLEALITSHTASAMKTAGLWIDKMWLIMLNGLKNIIVAAGGATSLWSYTSAFYWYPPSLRIGDTSFVSVHLMCVYLCVCVYVTPPLWAPHAAAAAAAWAWLNRFSTDCLLPHCRCKKQQSSIILLFLSSEAVNEYGHSQDTIIWVFIWKSFNETKLLST